MTTPFPLTYRPLIAALIAAFTLAACGGGDDDAELVAPGAPQGLGHADTAPVPDERTVKPFVDTAASNQRGDARYATVDTNAGVRVVAGMLDIWEPSSRLVDAGVTADAHDGFPAISPSPWTGIPGDASDGKVKHQAIHDYNIRYVVDVTRARTPAQELQAYLDDRRGKGYSVSDGMGPLAEAWRTASVQTTTITGIAPDATTVKYDDAGNDVGVGGAANPRFGTVIDFINGIGENGSTEPAKRFYKYARPWRWSRDVVVVPALEPAKSTTPATDGGFISGHTAEGVRKSLAMAYVVPQRFQEMVARSLEMGESRILAGMHSPLDVIGGRVQAQAIAAANIANGTSARYKDAAYAQAQSVLAGAAGVADAGALYDYAHAWTVSQDRFADHAAAKAEYRRRLTFGFPQIADAGKAAVVPKQAEVLLETRLPYLSAEQRRVVLKTTALPSGYPVMDDAEGWGRLNLFDAADGYGRFDGDVAVRMDAARGGFHARDRWNNDIDGAGKLTLAGSGALTLTGDNRYTGGTEVQGGTLVAGSPHALGRGDVYVSGGALATRAGVNTVVGGNLSVLPDATLAVSVDANGGGNVTVAQGAFLDGTLSVTLAPGFVPAKGQTISILGFAQRKGEFKRVLVDGASMSANYGDTGVSITF